MKIPKLLVGAPGIGKTQITESQYEHTEKLLTSAMVEEDIAGLIYREGEDEKRTVPAFIRRIQKAVREGKKTCLFLDEVDKGRREVVDTLLTLITHQETYGVPREVDIILAANPPEWGGGDGASIPLLNRVAVIPVSPKVEDWTKWVRATFGQNAFVDLVIERVENGEIPLLETTGENFERRTTSPRSLAMSMSAFLSEDLEIAKQISDGLLTPNASSSLFFTFQKSKERRENEDQKVNNIATKIAALRAKKIILKIA